MRMLVRILLGLSAVLSILCAAIHASAYGKAAAAISGSSLASFFSAAFKGLWLIDSATLSVLGLALGLIAARPQSASRALIVLLSLIPAATAVLLYGYMGNFPPAHILAATALMTFVAALLLPASIERSSP